MTQQAQRPLWIDQLRDDDLAFVRRFILSSGSLKAMAKAYGISYPTVRLRLDRLIEKIKLVENREIVSQFEKRLRVMHAEGRISAADMASLLTVHRQELGEHDAPDA